AVGFAGTVVMALPGVGSGTGPDMGNVAPSNQTGGVLMILAALVSYGVAINLARPLQQRNGALAVVWRAQSVAVLLTAPRGIPAVLTAHWSLRPVLALLALGAFGTAIAYALTATAAGRLGATRASSTTFLIPVVALILGILLRHESVPLLAIAGSGIC